MMEGASSARVEVFLTAKNNNKFTTVFKLHELVSSSNSSKTCLLSMKK